MVLGKVRSRYKYMTLKPQFNLPRVGLKQLCVLSLQVLSSHTVSAQIEHQHCIKIWDFLARHNGNFAQNFIRKITIFLDEFSPKLISVCPKKSSWHSNREWSSICGDMVWAYWLCLTLHQRVTLNVFLLFLKYIWQISLAKFSVSLTFFDRTDRIWTERKF